MLAQIEALRAQIEAGITREELQQLLPAGGARNVLDCALVGSRGQARRPAGLATGRPAATQAAADDLHAGRGRARSDGRTRGAYAAARAIKLKLTDDDLQRRARAGRARRRARMYGSWSMPTRASPASRSRGCCRPWWRRAWTWSSSRFRSASEAWLDGLERPIRIAADESVQDRSDLAEVVGRVDVINIKLDKCGGLTEALAIASGGAQARLST